MPKKVATDEPGVELDYDEDAGYMYNFLERLPSEMDSQTRHYVEQQAKLIEIVAERELNGI